MKSGTYRARAVAALILAGACTTVSAQDAGDTIASADDDIETIIVIGEREPGNFFLSSQDFELTQATTLDDLFANESSVAVGGGSAVAQKIYVRGFEDVMLNVTIDGAQSPGELYHHQGRVQLEPEFMKRVELDAGAGAATNGPGALTGAMRVTLKDAFDMLGSDRDFGAFLKATGRYNGDNGEEYTGSAYGRLHETLGVIVGYTYQDRGDYEDGNGDVPGPSSYERNRGFLKLNGDMAAHQYGFTYENLRDDAETYERPNLVNWGGTYQLSDQEMSRDTFSFNYGYTPDTDAVSIDATVFYNATDFLVQRQNSDTVYGDGDFESTGVDLRNTSLLGAHSITYGVDYRQDSVVSSQNATPPFAWGSTEQDATVAGLYAQDNWQLTDTFSVSFGVRYDDYSFEGTGGVSDGADISDGGVSPNVSLTWEVIDGLTLRAAYAEAFRGVMIREAFFSALYVHDGTLEPEEADNVEFGIAWERNGYFVRGTVYEQSIRNFIDIEFTGPAPVWGYWRNTGTAEVEGYEIEAGRQAGNYFLSFGVWNVDNTLDGEPLVDSNLGLGTSIGRTWLGRFRYDFSGFGADLGLDLRHVEAQDNPISPTAPAKGSYSVVNLYTNWRPTEQLTLALAANNLLDEFYYDHATYTWLGGNANTYVGYPAKGREIVASLSYAF